MCPVTCAFVHMPSCLALLSQCCLHHAVLVTGRQYIVVTTESYKRGNSNVSNRRTLQGCCEPTPLFVSLTKLCQSVVSCHVKVMSIVSIDAWALSLFFLSSKTLLSISHHHRSHLPLSLWNPLGLHCPLSLKFQALGLSYLNSDSQTSTPRLR